MRGRISSSVSQRWLKLLISLKQPAAPPSDDAPLSGMIMMSVLSSSPISSSAFRMRPKSWSACSRKPANTSIRRV